MSVGSGENYDVSAPSRILKAGCSGGTDDGKLTRDGGSTWTDLTRNLSGEARNQWIRRI